jgi:threonine/homoserine/homoserine lactone efflux protein
MDIIILAAIASASAINSAMPGPCIALTIGRSAGGGLRAGLSVTLGVLAANFMLASLALSAMLGILSVSEHAFTAMRWCGAGVLIAIAVPKLVGLRSPSIGICPATGGAPSHDLAAGLMIGLSSPFNLVFLLALLPQLVPSHLLDATAVALVAAAVVVGAAASQIGATLVGTASRELIGGATRRIEFAGSLFLVGCAIAAIARPLP